jgi:hypothetical protein
MIARNELFQFLASVGFSDNSEVHVRAFAAKKTPLEYRLRRRMAYSKNGQILPLSPMAIWDLNTDSIHLQNGINKGKTFKNGLNVINSWNQQGYGIYFVVNPGGQSDQEIAYANNLFYEIDSLAKDLQYEKLRDLEAAVGVEATVVETLNSLHCYFRLSEPIQDLSYWKQCQERLIQRQQSDISIRTYSRVMRLPTFQYWLWDDEAKELTRPQQVQLIKTNGSVELDQLLSMLPEWNQERWNPKPDTMNTAVVDLGEYYWMPAIAAYLPGFNSKGRQGWATMQCPYQGPGHSNNPSSDSLHVDMDRGGFKCHGGCDSKDVMHAAVAYAQQYGYPSFEEWARAKGIFPKAETLELLDPGDISTPPPNDEPPVDFPVMPLPGKTSAQSEFDHLQNEPVQPFGDIATAPLPPGDGDRSELPPDDQAPLDDESLTVVSIKGTDKKDADQKNSVLRSLELSDFGQMLVSNFCYLVTEDAYYDLERGELLTKAQLQAMWNHLRLLKSGNWIEVNGKAFKVSADKLLQAHARTAYQKVFHPGKTRLLPPPKSSAIPHPNLNTWSPYPKGLKPDNPGEAAQPWIEHLNNLFPGPAANVLTWFLAYTLRRPGTKILWAPLLHSTELQNGKESIFRPVSWALGKEWHKQFHTQCQDGYNSWLEGKKLVLFNEVTPWERGKRYPDPNEFMKTFLGGSSSAQRVITIDGKFERQRKAFDYANFILCTNHRHAINITQTEKRYLPVTTNWKGTPDYYETLHRWYEDNDHYGFKSVVGYLQSVDLEQYSPYSPPLEHSDFEHFVVGSRSDAEQVLSDYLDDLRESNAVTTDRDCAKILEAEGEQFTSRELERLLNSLQWAKAPARRKGKDIRVRYGKGKANVVHPYSMSIELAIEKYKNQE